MAKCFNFGYSSVLFRMVIRISAFQGTASPCGIPLKQIGFVKKSILVQILLQDLGY